MTNQIEIIEAAFADRQKLTPSNTPADIRQAIEDVLSQLDSGELRVAEKRDGEWIVHQWVKKAVLLSFRTRKSVV